VLRAAVRGQRRNVAVAAVLFTSYQVGESLVPLVIGAVIDRGVATGDGGAMARWLLVLLASFVLLSYSYMFGARAARRSLVNAEHDLRMDVVRRVLDHRGGAEDGRLPGGLANIATSDAERVSYVNGALAHGVGAILGLGFAAVALLRISIPLGLLVLLGTPPLLWIIHQLGRPLQRRADAEQERAAQAAGIAADLTVGLRVLTGLGAQRAAIERYRGSSRTSLAARLRATTANAWYEGSILTVNGVFLAVVALVGGRLAMGGDISVGELVAAVGLAKFLVEPLQLLGIIGAELAQGRASADRIAAVLAAPPAVAGEDAAGATAATPVRGALRLRGVVEPPLTGLDLDVEAGETVGVVTGDPAAAAALLRCLAREADPAAGRLELDGVPLRDLHPADVRAAILVAEHGAALFDDTVRENVVAAADPALPVGLDRVLKATGADEVVRSLPDGLETPVAERGQSLSGGQRQRIVLARALAAARPVLVLHEPTTAVDSVTEARIAAGVRDLRAGRTTVLVTTSPALLAVTDRVVVIEDGAITAAGTHAELAGAHDGYRAAVLA
jgi:putative ABC transport system ATP-binding protein